MKTSRTIVAVFAVTGDLLRYFLRG
jgi:hypothetical protein